MENEAPISDAMRNALRQAQAIDGIHLSDDPLSVRSRDDLRRVEIPEFIDRWLPEGTELRGTTMRVPELGSHSVATGLRLTIPFGPKRAAITFD